MKIVWINYFEELKWPPEASLQGEGEELRIDDAIYNTCEVRTCCRVMVMFGLGGAQWWLS